MKKIQNDKHPIQAVPLFSRELYETVIETLLYAARESIWIVTANVKNIFVKNPRNPKKLVTVFELLSYLIERNITIRLLHSAKPSRSFNDYIEPYADLFNRGLDMRQCPRVHMKTIIIDDTCAYVGSANFTGAGIGIKGQHKRNFELGFITEDSAYIREIECIISTIWYGEACRDCKLRERCPSPIAELHY